jgi:hypothetical protein
MAASLSEQLRVLIGRVDDECCVFGGIGDILHGKRSLVHNNSQRTALDWSVGWHDTVFTAFLAKKMVGQEAHGRPGERLKGRLI